MLYISWKHSVLQRAHVKTTTNLLYSQAQLNNSPTEVSFKCMNHITQINRLPHSRPRPYTTHALSSATVYRYSAPFDPINDQFTSAVQIFRRVPDEHLAKNLIGYRV